jgi:hypothetical protein
MASSKEVVRNWANLQNLPADAAPLQALWAASGRRQAADWGAGSLYLAADLKPFEIPPQNITQAYVQNLNPNTVGQLGASLGW